MAQPAFTGFPPESLKFLRELQKNNNRDWFNERKERYEEDYVAPALKFIEAMAPRIKKISPFLEAIPKKTRGSLLRIYRDTRFSPNKTPYKTHIGIQFRHEAGSSIHAPGCYLHIQPGNVFLGVGTWHPERNSLLWIREKIAAEPKEWQQILKRKRFAEQFKMAGDSLVRPPKGFDKDHPAIEEIKRKDFIAVTEFEEKQVQEPDFPQLVTSRIRLAVPMMAFLCEALELSF